jgi:addiction module RelE/StbE family toxin
MAQVIWAPAALDDVDAIAEYIARDSPDHAALFATRLIEATDRLAQFPESGRVLPELGRADCREIIVGDYRIIYRIATDAVWVTGVIHGARDVQAD